MDGAEFIKIHFSAKSINLVNQARNGPCVPWNCPRGHGDGVARMDAHGAVFTIHHTRQGRHGFTLRACHEQDHVAVCDGWQVQCVEVQGIRQAQEAMFVGEADIVHEATPAHHHCAAKFCGQVENFLDALDMA